MFMLKALLNNDSTLKEIELHALHAISDFEFDTV